MTQIPAELPDVEANERLKAIYGRIVEKMKDVVREFEITQDELHVAGDYLNRLGQSGFCRSLIDVSLAMTSVDVTARVDGATRPNLEGPFHQPDMPVRDSGTLFLSEPTVETPLLLLSGKVTDTNGQPIPNAYVDVWQADHVGHYDLDEFALFGRIPVDAAGRYEVLTTVPKDYSDHDHDPIGELFRAMGRHNRRAAHIHIKVWEGDACLLTTQLFIPGNPYLDSDYVEGAVSDELLLNLQPTEDGKPNSFAAEFDFAVARAA